MTCPPATLAPTPPANASQELPPDVSRRSSIGLNAANFFIAELSGVVIPFLNDFLRSHEWRYDSIGIATALVGLGVLILQTPAGLIVDRFRQRRGLLASASLLLGICFGLVPLAADHWWLIDPLLFLAGAGRAFFDPLLGALALGLVGYSRLSRTVGANQGWNHAGNIAAALSAMLLVSAFGTAAIFYAVAVVSVVAAFSLALIRADEVDERLASGSAPDDSLRTPVGIAALFRDRRIVVLFVSIALFHLANAPTMPLVALYVKHLQGTHTEIAAVVLVAQIIMIPVALVAGAACDRFGRKPVFALAFLVLPLRIVLYAFARSPAALIALQTLDGVGAGIYGVVVIALCADLTHGKGGFNALTGLTATALAVGGVLGPLLGGLVVQALGFTAAFCVFAGIAACGAAVFIGFMPETRHAPEASPA